MATSIFGIILWASQMTLAQSAACPTEQVIERSDQGTFVGAIAECTESSAGVWFDADGTITIEVR